MPYPFAPWRAALQPASFSSAGFHVEVGGQAGGRRIALHEFPKKNKPYAEDMGRRAQRVQISAYLLGPFYTADRDALIAACEQEGPGTLVHPTLGSMRVVCEGYRCEESREKGGFCAFELSFVEAGQAPANAVLDDTQAQSTAAAENADAATAASLNTSLAGTPASAADSASVTGAGGANNAGFGTIPSNGFAGVPLT